LRGGRRDPRRRALRGVRRHAPASRRAGHRHLPAGPELLRRAPVACWLLLLLRRGRLGRHLLVPGALLPVLPDLHLLPLVLALAVGHGGRVYQSGAQGPTLLLVVGPGLGGERDAL